MTQIPAQLNFPRMSPDGRYLYALINWGLFRIDLRTKERVRSVSVDEPTFDLSSDGKHIAFVAREGGSFVLKVQSTDAGEQRVVLRLRPDERINSIAWKPGSDFVFLAKQNAETIQLFELDTRAASEPVPLGIFVKTFCRHQCPPGRQAAGVPGRGVADGILENRRPLRGLRCRRSRFNSSNWGAATTWSRQLGGSAFRTGRSAHEP